jgi:O-antigen ligase
VGSALVWFPAAVILLLTGSVGKGILLLVIGALLIGLADNGLRPLLVGRDTKMPDYLILITTLGGLTFFGLSGVVIGPIIAALFLVVWDMFREIYGKADAELEEKEEALERQNAALTRPSPPEQLAAPHYDSPLRVLPSRIRPSRFSASPHDPSPPVPPPEENP